MVPPRGAILKARFPFETSPTEPGPFPHYCLFGGQMEGRNGESLFLLAYGTSRLDDEVIRLHGHGHGILSVDSQFVRGEMSGRVTHFLARHVAVVSSRWVHDNWRARLDFVRPEARLKDQYRQRLFQQFEAWEEVMDNAASAALAHFLETGVLGLPPGSRLRPGTR